ncbi:hypothetical protein ACU4HD_17110 [Cupriavidus basilensis]
MFHAPESANFPFKMVRLHPRARSGKRQVGVVGLNTAWLCDGDRDKEGLTPGIQITRAAIEKVKVADIKFVLGHHPLDWVNQSHVSTLKSIFAENQVIYLHGHMHAESFSNLINGSGSLQRYRPAQPGKPLKVENGKMALCGEEWTKASQEYPFNHIFGISKTNAGLWMDLDFTRNIEVATGGNLMLLKSAARLSPRRKRRPQH